MSRLKAETREEHALLEASLDLLNPRLTRPAYASILERFFGCYAPLEAVLRSVDGWGEYGLDLTLRLKTPLLEADLLALGRPSPEALPVCSAWASLDDLASAFGCSYVVEGASLGGQIISRHVEANLGIVADTGASFFRGYGKQTGEMWSAFRQALVSFVARGGSSDRIVASALTTFRSLHSWCAAGQRGTRDDQPGR
jgi:heme oxygenase